MLKAKSSRIIQKINLLKEEAKAFDRKRIETNKKWLDLEIKLHNQSSITNVTTEAVQMRKKVLANNEIKSIMEMYGICLEELGLVVDWDERISSFGYPDDPKYVFTPKNNSCESRRTYIYGGPQSGLKAIFRDCQNGRYMLTGYQFKFPEKPKRDWKAIFKGKAA
jgi:hypothetical protein